MNAPNAREGRHSQTSLCRSILRCSNAVKTHPKDKWSFRTKASKPQKTIRIWFELIMMGVHKNVDVHNASISRFQSTPLEVPPVQSRCPCELAGPARPEPQGLHWELVNSWNRFKRYLKHFEAICTTNLIANWIASSHSQLLAASCLALGTIGPSKIKWYQICIVCIHI